MKPTPFLFKLFFLIGFVVALHQSCIAQQTIPVSNVWELYRSLGSNRILELDTGVYDLDILLDQQYEDLNKMPMHPKGAEILNTHDLTIKGKSKGRTMIVLSPKYGWTVYFGNCQNIQLTNLILGHSAPQYCWGGVLKFIACTQVEISHCDLFGSGTIGLALDSCADFKINETTVHDCTDGLVDLFTSNDIKFSQTHFRNTHGGMTFMNTPDVYFEKCSFENNDASGLQSFFYLWQQYYVMEAINADEEEFSKKVTIKTKIYLDSCLVKENIFESFTNDRRRLIISGTKMENNTIYKEQ